MVAGRTHPAGVARMDGKYITTTPCLLVLQLAAKLAPALIENRLIVAGLCFAAQATLVFCQRSGVPAQGVDRLKYCFIRDRSKQRNTCTEANNRCRRMHKLSICAES